MKTVIRALAVSVLSIIPVFWLGSSAGADNVNNIVGTAGDDFIIVGAADARVTPGAGDDFLVGGPGNNRYVIGAGEGEDTLYAVEGDNYIEFESSIAYGDVASGLMKSGDDLVFNIGQAGQSLTVKRFFAVAGTIKEFQFASGGTIPSSLLFQVFGLSAPTLTESSKVPHLAEEGEPLLSGSEVADILVPIETTEVLRGKEGDDFLVGRANGVTFEIGVSNGEDFIIAYEGQNVVLFVDGIGFGDVASNLMKAGDDLILRTRVPGNQVRIYKFFTRANTVSAIRFESGGEISSDQLINLFGVPEPAEAPPFQMIVDGLPLDGGGGAPGGDGSGEDLPLCSEPDADPTNCEEDASNPPDGSCDPATESCGGSGGGDAGGSGGNSGSAEDGRSDLLRLSGTTHADLLVASDEATLVNGRAGDDFLIGGPLGDRFVIAAGDGLDVIHDVEGNNVVEFTSGISYSSVASGLMKAGDDLVLNIGQDGQRLTVRHFFTVKDTILEFEFENGNSLTSAQLFQAFGVSPPTEVGQSLNMVAGTVTGSPLLGTPAADIVIPRMGTSIVRGLGGDDYLIARVGYDRAGEVETMQLEPGKAGAVEPMQPEPGAALVRFSSDLGVTFEITPDSGRKFVIAYEGKNKLRYTGSSARENMTFSRIADDLILGNSQNDSQVRVYQFFARQSTISVIEFDNGDRIYDTDLFDMFGVNRPVSNVEINMVVAGASFDSCWQNPRLDTAEGYGRTDSQLADTNVAPMIHSSPLLEAWALRDYDYAVQASDPLNDELCFDLHRSPEGMSIDYALGLISWEPERSQIGNHTVEVAVTDERGLSTVQNFEIEVKDPNKPPVFSGIALSTAVVGHRYKYQLIARDPDSYPGTVSLELMSGPSGMILVDGALNWTPTPEQLGSHSVSVAASDKYGAVTEMSFGLHVVPFLKSEDMPEGQSRIPQTGARYSAHALDDASLKIGTNRVFERDNTREVVIDRVNGLIWQDNEEVLGETHTVSSAWRKCSDLELGGIDNWRLPNRLELVFLMEHYRDNQKAHLINGAFEHVGFRYDNDDYIAKNYPAYGRINKWNSLVDFFHGEVLPEDGRSDGRNARCVSGDLKFVSEFHKPEHAQEVTVDRPNRLMWQDSSDVLNVEEDFDGAMAYCEALNLAGHSDWRVPNFNESQLLMREFEYFVEDGWSGRPKHFDNVPENRHWQSSTLYSGNYSSADGTDTQRNFRFRYQYDVESNYAGSLYANLNFTAVNSSNAQPVRCIRSYAEPTPQVAQTPPQSVNVGETVVLDASPSHHADGEVVRYRWQNVTTDRLLGETATTEAVFNVPGQHEVRLTVWDQHGLSQTHPETFSIVVYGPPEVVIEGPSAAWAGESVVLDASKSSDFSGIARYQWSRTDTGADLGQNAQLTLTDLEAGVWEYQLRVTNERGVAATKGFILSAANRPDVFVDGERDVLLGDTVTLDAAGTSSDTDIVEFKWLDSESGELLGQEAVLELAGLPAGIHSVTLVLTDTNGLTHQETYELNVDNHVPVVVVEGHAPVAQGTGVVFDAGGSYVPQGSVEHYRWFEAGSSTPIDETSQLSLSGLPVGTWTYKVEVESLAGKIASKVVSVEVGHRPVASVPDTIYAYAHRDIEVDGSASSVAEGTLEYEWQLAGDKVSDTPVARLDGMEAGEYEILLTVRAALGLSDTEAMTLVVEPPRELVSCPVVSVEDDRGYEVLYPENDVEWRGNNAATVEDIERAFNFARSQDPSVFQYLIMPSQQDWDAMNLQEKGLYLVNAERKARGIKPYEGIAPEVTSVAQEYAGYIRTRNEVIGHYNDGLSPSDRLDTDAYIAANRDAYRKLESLASGSGGPTEYSEDEALVKAIFGWVYQDKSWFEDFEWATGPAWGHRDHVLETRLDENSGVATAEGLAGFGVSRGPYGPGQASPETQGYVTVFHTVNQNQQWDLSTVTATDTSGAQGCNTVHILDIDDSLVETNGLADIQVSPSTRMMVPGDTQSIQVKAVYENGNEVDITPYASFIADNRSIVTVSNGSLTAEQAGQAQVFARINGVESNRLFVRVREATDTGNLQGTPAEAYAEYVPENASVSSYDPKAMAVYTGEVIDRAGLPVEGVQASFLNRPGLGSTKTGSDGRFIIAGPAGPQTIVYEKPGHLVVQRTTIGASNGWSNLENVVLLPRDSKQTLIDLTDGTTQVHQSTPVTDQFGERQATLVFNGITSATVVSADGSTRELDQFLLSATEFEVPESMPGELPRETAFTFANDLHVAGVHFTDSVVFDNDVVMFVDNFLDFQVGEIVPIGYFDRLENQWVASSNGVVVQVLDQSGNGDIDGVDYTGDGVADDLNGNGNTEDDALGLEGYNAGDTLWWGSFNHFTPVDYNWGSSEDQAPTDLETDLVQEDEKNEETECTGSYVKPYQQTFHEDISIAGTDLTLHYSSQRTEGYKHKARIKVSGASIPATLERMIVKLEVAGHVFQRELAPAANTEVEFIWDGTRIDGKRPEGMVSGRVSIGYEYPALYLSSGNAAEEDRELSEFPVAWATTGDTVTQVPGRQNYTSWQTRGVSFKNSFDRQLANGWSLSNVHEFDPAGQVYLGNGGVVDVETQSLVLKTGLTYSLINGDDGYYQSGGSSIDYIVDDQGILVDKVTGLEWEFVDQPYETRTKADARAYCEVEVGSGWRLPTAKEVGYNIEKSDANVGPAIYSLSRATNLWRQSSVNPDEKLKPVICVRGESMDERYVQGLKRDASQQVVVDQENGLMWQDAPQNTSQKLDWEASIQHCEASSFAGFEDWRLPNINELLYVLPNDIFENQTELVFPDGEYWQPQASFRKPYWSSTTNFQNDEQAWAIESASFNSERFSKNDEYNVRCVRDASSSSRMPYRFDNEGRHIATIDLDSGKTLVEFAYNDNGKLHEITDRFGNTLSIERNAEGKPQRIVAPDGQVTELAVNEQNNLTALTYGDGSDYQFFYQAGGLLTEKVDPNGYSYPHEFNENGRVYQTRDPEGGQWDFFDNRVGIGHNEYGYTTAEGNQYQTVRRLLDNGDVRKEITYKNGSTLVEILRADQLQQTTSYGGVTTIVDKVLDPKTLQEIPNVITVTQPSGLASTTAMTKTYGQNGADTTRYNITTNVNGDVSTTEVDARAGTLTRTSAEGRVIAEVVDPDTLLTQSVSVAGMLDSQFDYDQRGRLVEQAVGDRSTSYSYGVEGRGQVTAITAADGKQTQYEYDLLGRVTKVTYPDGHATLSNYDENGNQTTLVVPTPADHDNTFNGINRVTSETTPLGETTQYEYDRDRRLTAIELPSGERLENTYTQNRLTRTDTPEGAILYDYHHGDQLSQVSEGSETLSYTWDGSLLKEAFYQGELNDGIQYGHNANFQVSQVTYAGGSTSLTYDRDSLLTGIHGFTIGRHADHGLPVSLDDGTLNKTFAYNGHGEVTDVSTELNQTAVYDYDLTYNSVGQIVGKTETMPDGTVHQYNYTYDDRYRLTEVTKNSQLVEQYQYDANGNRTRATSTERGVSNATASYNLGDQLQSLGNTSYSYDDNGRLSQTTTGTDVTTYDYDSQGRLKQVQTPAHTIEYRHNALGNRVAKVKDGAVVERYLWQDKTTLLATYDGNGNLKQRFEYTLGHAPTSFTENGETYYLLTDQLGSPRVITDSAGQVVKAIEYDAYGNVISDSNPGFEIPFGFAGGLNDPDTGLIRFGYRDYDPQTGRWTARDPIGFAGGDTNLYGYVSNDPVNFVDPTGEIAWAVFGAIVGAGGELAWQMIVEGKSLGCVDVSRVGAAAAMGALGGGASGLNKLSKLDRAADFSKVATTTSKQLQKKFKHAKDFGVNGNFSKDNAKKFNQSIQKHMNSPGTKEIQGSYRGNPVTFHTDSKSGLTVIQNPNGSFLSGWKLNPQQLNHVLKDGKL